MWIRYRFEANADDPRPLIWPTPGPYWVTGYGGFDNFVEEEDDEEQDLSGGYAIIVAYLLPGEDICKYWPEANNIDQDEEDEIRFSGRFPKPDWWPDNELLED